MDNTFIILGAIVVFGGLVGIIAYLYRESALIQGKSEIGIGPIKFKLGSSVQTTIQDSKPDEDQPMSNTE